MTDDPVVASYAVRITIHHPTRESAPDPTAVRVAQIIEARLTSELHEYPDATVNVTVDRTDR